MLNRSMDLRYLGQGYELNLPIAGEVTKGFVEDIRQKYNNHHNAVYGYFIWESPLEIVNLRLTGLGMMNMPKLKQDAEDEGDSTGAMKKGGKSFSIKER